MKLVGLLGGMSWESTAYYYRELNRGVRDRLGGLHSAACIIVSVDFADVEKMQSDGHWDQAAKYLARRAHQLELAGAGALVLCTNTMHKVFAEIEASINIPAIHIADGAAAALLHSNIRKVALLGTRHTMEQRFYVERLGRHEIEVLVPTEAERERVHAIIYEELCLGIVKDDSRTVYVKVIESLRARGAEAVILGCTEIGLLIKESDSPLPVFDTTLLHVQAALDWSLGGIEH